MAFALLIIGIVLLTSAIRNTQDFLVLMLRADFTGTGNFTYWVIALIVVGAVGYVEKLKPISDGLLVLILLALFLTRGSPAFPGGGFFSQFTRAIGTSQNAGGTLNGISIGFGPTPGSTTGNGPILTPGSPSPYPIPTTTGGGIYIGFPPPGRTGTPTGLLND